MTTRIIGDVHGYFDRYVKIIKDCKSSIQLGDMGVGFPVQNPHKEKRINDNLLYGMNKGSHWFIRGNHDNPETCRAHPKWITDGYIKEDVMFIGGAWSIDQAYRTPGYTWWDDEECSYSEFGKMLELYEKTKPRVMITHDCPSDVANEMFLKHGLGVLGSSNRFFTRTGEALQQMFEVHQPKYWYFGHWHKTMEMVINKTHFHCLGELDFVDVNLFRNRYQYDKKPSEK